MKLKFFLFTFFLTLTATASFAQTGAPDTQVENIACHDEGSKFEVKFELVGNREVNHLQFYKRQHLIREYSYQVLNESCDIGGKKNYATWLSMFAYLEVDRHGHDANFSAAFQLTNFPFAFDHSVDCSVVVTPTPSPTPEAF